MRLLSLAGANLQTDNANGLGASVLVGGRSARSLLYRHHYTYRLNEPRQVILLNAAEADVAGRIERRRALDLCAAASDYKIESSFIGSAI